MSTCQGCGGVIGRDCYNPAECEMIARDMEMQEAERNGLTDAERETLHGLREKRLVAVPAVPTEAWWNSVAVRLDAHPSSLFMDRLRDAHAQLMLAAAQEPSR